jgi:FkbM family methyltransferase
MFTVSGENRSIHLPDHMAEYQADLNHDIEAWLAPYDEDVTEFDFTNPRHTKLHGLPYKVWLPSFTESVARLREQYLDVVDLRKGDVVIDCGGFAGITAMLFADAVGKDGTVVTVEPDFINFKCLSQNLADYFCRNGYAPFPIQGAIWHEDGGLEFNSDGAMGSAVSAYVGARGTKTLVAAYSLSTIAGSLPSVKHVKLDIESAEVQVLQDEDFWNTHRPTVTVECHNGNEKIVRGLLLALDYEVAQVPQVASQYVLWHGTPK